MIVEFMLETSLKTAEIEMWKIYFINMVESQIYGSNAVMPIGPGNQVAEQRFFLTPLYSLKTLGNFNIWFEFIARV